MTVYILHSEQLSRFYVGLANDVSARVQQHNQVRGHWTSQARDWRVIWQREVGDRAEARGLEKQIKARGAARWLAEYGRLPGLTG